SYVNNIKYGLLSVDVWRDHVEEIVSDTIGEFLLSPSQENDLKNIVSNILRAVLDKTDGLLKKKHKTLGGKIQKMVVTTFIDTSDLRKKVPDLTETIVKEVKKPDNSEKLKHLAQTQLDQFAEQTYDNNRNPAQLNALLMKHLAKTSSEFNHKVR